MQTSRKLTCCVSESCTNVRHNVGRRRTEKREHRGLLLKMGEDQEVRTC